MATTISGTNGVSQIQDGIVTQGKLAAASVTDGKLDLTANSAEVKEALNASGTAPIYACRAWVNFDGAGTVSIRASGNVSSITDNGTGDYTVNFATAMEDADYAVCIGHTSFTASTVNFDVGVRSAINEGPPTLQTTTQVRLLSQMSNGNDKDSGGVYLSIFR